VASSAPGPDGLPYRAWSAAGLAAGETREQMFGHLLEGRSPPRDFLHSLAVYIHKASPNWTALKLSAQQLTPDPIGLKNTDNNVICTSSNFKLRRVTTERACVLQRGFVPGRLLTQNPIDLDAAARPFGRGVSRFEKPLLAFWDFKSEFPSLAHECVTVGALQLPCGF
jgi:hypothetical protein